MDELYREIILDHYKNPKNKGTLERYTHKHRELNESCGDEITVYLQFKEDKIKEIRFTGQGCAISQASTSLLTEKIKGKTRAEIDAITKEDILNMLGIEVGFGRMKCALLPLKAIQKTLGEENES